MNFQKYGIDIVVTGLMFCIYLFSLILDSVMATFTFDHLIVIDMLIMTVLCAYITLTGVSLGDVILFFMAKHLVDIICIFFVALVCSIFNLGSNWYIIIAGALSSVVCTFIAYGLCYNDN